MQKSKVKIITILYLVTIIGLFFYSYTQVDLGLTLTRHPMLYPIQRFFQHVGYFQRPLSTYIFLALLVLLFVSYSFFIVFAWKNKLSVKLLCSVIFVQSAILLFSYNAFSYDIFNYIFDARIITHYHQNPYLHRALDYPGDPMLGFMHWTQRLFPYGPVWLAITLLISLLGFQYFLLTFFLFKTLAVVAYALSVYFVWKILENTLPEEKLLGTVFFALNPLVIIESLVSAHNDIVSTCLILFAVYLFTIKNYIRSLILLIISFGIKFLSIFIFPILLYLYILKRNIKKDWRKIYFIFSIFMAIPVILESLRTNFQPWYLLSVLPFIALIGKRAVAVISLFTLTFFSLLEYVPFLWTGNWDPPIPAILNILTLGGVALSLLFILILKAKNMLQLS